MTLPIPARPAVPESHRGRGKLALRYEDVSQCGRVHPPPLTHAIGVSVWADALRRHPLTSNLQREGIIPILSRLVARSLDAPISALGALDCDGAFALRRAAAPDGADRFRVDMWAEATGRRGRTWGPAPEGAGEPIVVGEVYGEHTLTRLFAAPEDRRVTALPDALRGHIDVLDAPPSRPEDSAALPDGARWIDEVWHPAADLTRFGLGHTDANQHVNSLVYPNLFEEAALARLDALGHGTERFTSAFDLGFRKPLFAGERARVAARAFALGDALGACCVAVAHDAAVSGDALPARAHCYGRVILVR